MTVPARMWTDGSCAFAYERPRVEGAPGPARGSGGWAAIVERGSEGWVRRGREPDTTSTRMELRALVGGLSSLPDRVPVVCTVDCTVAIVVHQKWLAGLSLRRLERRFPDGDLWLELIGEFERLHVGFRLLGRNQREAVHRRAHVIAGAEARALRAGLEQPPMPGMGFTPMRGWFLPAELDVVAARRPWLRLAN